MWFKEICSNAAFVGGIVILTLGIPDMPSWAKIVIGCVLVIVGAVVALH